MKKVGFDKNFKEVIFLFNKKKINYWLCHGTLLGIVRNKNLIPWDHDVDLAVWTNRKTKKNIYSMLLNKGYKKKKKFFKGDNLLTMIKKGGREIDVNFYELSKSKEFAFQRHFYYKNFFIRFVDVISKSNNYNGNYKEIIRNFKFMSTFFKKIKKILIKNGMYYKEYGYMTPSHFFMNLKTIKVKKLKLRVPKNAINYVKLIYGKSWKKPKKKFNWITDSDISQNLK